MNKTFSGKRIILVCILTRPLQDYYRRSEHNADGISSKFIKTISAFVVLIARSMQSLAQPKQRLKQVGAIFRDFSPTLEYGWILLYHHPTAMLILQQYLKIIV